MMRTIEILLVIIILLGAFLTSSYFALLPPPRAVSQLNLAKLALTTLQTLDSDHSLSDTVFKNGSDPAWTNLQQALSACLPPNIIYNLTVYDTQSGSGALYKLNYSISNAANIGVTSLVSSYLATSANANFTITPQRINNTLYILNCSDANGWWITGYSAQSLAQDLYNLLNPYFPPASTILINSTSDLGKLLNGSALGNENPQNAIIINTCGEAVPIPDGYYTSPGVGNDTTNNSFALYDYNLGNKTRFYNWTWASIVGWPFYYVSNTKTFNNMNNTYGIFGMCKVTGYGLQAFLEGLAGQPYSYPYRSNSPTGNPGLVSLSTVAQNCTNLYGIYPSPQQTSTRALNISITQTYNLNITTLIFNQVGNWVPGAVYRNTVQGGFMAIGLARTPDIRLTAIGLLCDYRPTLSKPGFTVAGTSKLVVLQLGNVGGT
jgi:hypothetical protein